METSVQVKLFVILGVASACYAFYLDVRRGAENERFLEWLMAERSADWDGLTRADRFLTVRAVELLRRGALADDADFHARYQLTRHGIRFGVAMSVAGAAIALLIFGTTFLEWNW